MTDPKGENYAVTSRWRADRGDAVYAFDPFGLMEREAASFNPIDLIDATSPEAVDDARLLADMIVLPGARGEQEFWDEEARGVLTGLILHVAARRGGKGADAHAGAGPLLTLPPESFAKLLGKMREQPSRGGPRGPRRGSSPPEGRE